MKRLSSIALFLAVIVVVAAGAAGVGAMFFAKWNAPSRVVAHDWIHLELGLTADQEAALLPIESSYAERRDRLERALREANGALADAILADGRDSEGVHRAIEEIHSRMGDLQKETIGHVFEMRAVLTADQYDRLIALTAAALRDADAGTGEHGDSH
jgi:Spy/CpxP family protein refolding chaperone